MHSFLLLLLAFQAPVEADVLYSKAGGEELKMDIYRPAPKSNGGKSGAVIVLHGGAWMAGKRQDVAGLAQYLASKGLLAACPSYRLAPKHKWPAMLDDAQTAVRYLRANADKYAIDPGRIGAAGLSAGGHLSLLLGARETRDPKPAEHPGVSSRVRAVFNVFGPTDLSNDFGKGVDGMFAIVLGKPREEASEEIRDASPVTHVDAGDAPVFTLHGKADTLVPYKQAERLDEKLKAAKVPHELALVEGMGHSLNAQDAGIRSALDRAAAFLVRWLTPPAQKAESRKAA